MKKMFNLQVLPKLLLKSNTNMLGFHCVLLAALEEVIQNTIERIKKIVGTLQHPWGFAPICPIKSESLYLCPNITYGNVRL